MLMERVTRVLTRWHPPMQYMLSAVLSFALRARAGASHARDPSSFLQQADLSLSQNTGCTHPYPALQQAPAVGHTRCTLQPG